MAKQQQVIVPIHCKVSQIHLNDEIHLNDAETERVHNNKSTLINGHVLKINKRESKKGKQSIDYYAVVHAGSLFKGTRSGSG